MASNGTPHRTRARVPKLLAGAARAGERER